MIDRTKLNEALPDGTLQVGIGLVVAGISAYAFIKVANAALGNTAYAPLAVLWPVVFTAGPGFFIPIEQEVSRALAARRARGEGTGPVVRRAALLGVGLLGILLVLTVASSPVLVSELFSGEWLMILALLLALVGYWMGHLARGVFSGLGRFGPYSVYIGSEGAVRLLICVVLAIVGVKTAGPYGLALGVGPIVAVLLALRGQRDLVTPGPDAPWSELSRSLGALLAGSVLAQALLNAGVPAVELLAAESQKEQVSTFFLAVVISRLPLFLFQAVQAALLPKLSALASAGQLDEFRLGFRRLCIVVAAVGGLGTIGAVIVGPQAMDIVFKIKLTHTDLGLLAAGSAVYMLAMAIAQAVISLHGQKQVALSWLAGIAAFVAVTGLGHDLYLRVELGLLAGSVVALAAMAFAMRIRFASGAAIDSGDLIAALHDLPLEA